tara:strand:- start:24 stop:320 length:297 start_codon:yes stop_codon:yes gene_type:complete
MPIEYSDRDSFILSQFSSVMVTPVAKPSICVWTAVDAAVLQMSELLTTTLGALAVLGVLLVTTVEETVLVSAPLALVTALTIRIKVKIKNRVLTIYRP